MVLEDVTHRHQFDIFVAVQKLLRSFGAPPAASDETSPQFFVPRAGHQLRLDDGEGGRPRRCARGLLKKRSSRYFVGHFHDLPRYRSDCIVTGDFLRLERTRSGRLGSWRKCVRTQPESAGQFDITNNTGPNASVLPDMTFPITTSVDLKNLTLSVDFSDNSITNFGASYFTL